MLLPSSAKKHSNFRVQRQPTIQEPSESIVNISQRLSKFYRTKDQIALQQTEPEHPLDKHLRIYSQFYSELNEQTLGCLMQFWLQKLDISQEQQQKGLEHLLRIFEAAITVLSAGVDLNNL